MAPIPGEKRGRGARTYLHPVGAAASPGADGEASEKTFKNDWPPRHEDRPFASPPPYKVKNGGEAAPPISTLPTPRFAGGVRRSDGEAGDAGDIQDHSPEPLGGHVEGDGPDQIHDGDADLAEGQVEVEV